MGWDFLLILLCAACAWGSGALDQETEEVSDTHRRSWHLVPDAVDVSLLHISPPVVGANGVSRVASCVST